MIALSRVKTEKTDANGSPSVKSWFYPRLKCFDQCKSLIVNGLQWMKQSIKVNQSDLYMLFEIKLL